MMMLVVEREETGSEHGGGVRRAFSVCTDSCWFCNTMSKYPDHLSSEPLSKAHKSRARREPSGVFSLFQPNQIHLFREAFSLIDHDGDGVVSEQDLKHIFTSLGVKWIRHVPRRHAQAESTGVSASRQRIDELLNDRPGTHSRAPSGDEGFSGDRGITFPMFLTMMGEHLYDFDTEQELLAAFECFDDNDSGFVKCDEMRKWLSESGERMNHTDVSTKHDMVQHRSLNST
jgi:myosin regulatory light chain 12